MCGENIDIAAQNPENLGLFLDLGVIRARMEVHLLSFSIDPLLLARLID
jgi:hypothetical protein